MKQFSEGDVVRLANGKKAVVIKPGRVWTTVHYGVAGCYGQEPVRNNQLKKEDT